MSMYMKQAIYVDFEAKGFVIGFDNPLSRPLDLLMERGQKVALVGANGIGKTTVVRSFLGEIPALSGLVELGYFEQEMKKATIILVSRKYGRPSLNGSSKDN